MEKPDAVIVSIGAERVRPAIEGIRLPHVGAFNIAVEI